MDNSLRCGLYMFVCYALDKVVGIWYSESCRILSISNSLATLGPKHRLIMHFKFKMEIGLLWAKPCGDCCEWPYMQLL